MATARSTRTTRTSRSTRTINAPRSTRPLLRNRPKTEMPAQDRRLTASQMDAERTAALASGATAMLHAEASEYRLLSRDEEQALARLVHSSNAAEASAARDTFVAANVRLVGEVARGYARSRGGAQGGTLTASGLTLDDLMQEGMIGLLRAVDKFNPDYGFAFSTYAVQWIRQSISRAIIDRGYTIRVPAYLRQRQTFLLRLRTQMEAQTGIMPDEATLAEHSGCTLEEVAQALTLPSNPMSLTAALQGVQRRAGTNDDPVSLSEVLPDEAASAMFEDVEHRLDLAIGREAPDHILTLIQRLQRNPVHARQVAVAVRHITTDDTLEQIATEMGISRERVRQLELAGKELIRAERVKVRRAMRRSGAKQESTERKGGAA